MASLANFPFFSHFNMREASAIEKLRETIADHEILDLADEEALGIGRDVKEIVAYLERNQRKPRSAA